MWRSVAITLTALACAVQHTDSLRLCCGSFKASLLHENGPYLSLQLYWAKYFLCRMQRIYVKDALGRERVLERGQNEPITIESVEEFPLLHQRNYKFCYEYRCLTHHMWQNASFTLPKGEPLPLRGLNVSTSPNSATLGWEVPVEILSEHPSATVEYSLFKWPHYQCEPRMVKSNLTESVIITQLEPGEVYTVSSRIVVGSHKSKALQKKFIVGVPQELSRLARINVLSRYATEVTLQWEYEAKKILVPFIEKFEVEWELRSGHAVPLTMNTTDWRITLRGLKPNATYDVYISIYFTCGDRTMKGERAYREVFMECISPEVWKWVIIGTLIFASATILIVGGFWLVVFVRSKLKDRKRRQRAEFLARKLTTAPQTDHYVQFSPPVNSRASPRIASERF